MFLNSSFPRARLMEAAKSIKSLEKDWMRVLLV